MKPQVVPSPATNELELGVFCGAFEFGGCKLGGYQRGTPTEQATAAPLAVTLPAAPVATLAVPPQICCPVVASVTQVSPSLRTRRRALPGKIASRSKRRSTCRQPRDGLSKFARTYPVRICHPAIASSNARLAMPPMAKSVLLRLCKKFVPEGTDVGTRVPPGPRLMLRLPVPGLPALSVKPGEVDGLDPPD